VNTEPLPGSLATVTSPPIMRASLREMARPSPVGKARKVKNRNQAIATALKEAGASKYLWALGKVLGDRLFCAALISARLAPSSTTICRRNEGSPSMICAAASSTRFASFAYFGGSEPHCSRLTSSSSSIDI
jgi:hypothetical protein